MIMSLANPGMNIEQKIVPMLEIKGINVSRSRNENTIDERIWPNAL